MATATAEKVKPHLLMRHGPNHNSPLRSTDVSYVGKVGQRCADCIAWAKTGQKFNGPGEGTCSRDKAETWGGALCPHFQGRQ